jgi:hypothetical protein
MRVRFSATDNPNNSVTEAAIDAVQIYDFQCVIPPPIPAANLITIASLLISTAIVCLLVIWKGNTAMKGSLLAGMILIIAANVSAGPPPVPQTPTKIDNVVYVRQFILEEGYTHLWSKEKPFVQSGYLLVLIVDPGLVLPRQSLEPVLYVGTQTAQRINSGYNSGHVVAIVPGNLNLDNMLIWFGTPELPERISSNTIRLERKKALTMGIKPVPDEKINTALKNGGKPLKLKNLKELLQGEIARLILQYSPQEKQLAQDFRVPVTQ